MSKYLLFLFFSFLAIGCSTPKNSNTLRVLATPVPHAQILEFLQEDLKEKGITLIVLVSDDYNMPNRALAEKEVDANFFQHLPFLEKQIEHFDYPIEMLTKVEIEPMGIYSKRIQKLSELKDKSRIALPNDPTNEERALLLLEKEGLIKLSQKGDRSTLLSIVENPKNLFFLEVDAAMLPRVLEDVDLGLINTNYALEAGFTPLKDALALEDSNSPYANIVVVRSEESQRPELLALREAINSEKMRMFILKTYQGAIIPAF